MMNQATDFLHSWNSDDVTRLRSLCVEDDIRDAMQSIGVQLPTPQQREELLVLSDLLGVQYSFIGFPGSGVRELQMCSSLAQYIEARKLSVRPVFMARAGNESDILNVVGIQSSLAKPIIVDMFLSTCSLRHRVEGWTLRGLIEAARPMAALAIENGVELHVSLEDSTRTTPSNLALAIEAALEFEASSLVICDTVGECTPTGAARIVAFAMETMARFGKSIEIGWHGHNDKGLSTANALAAVNAGASIVSGTFLGVGERTGNIPLEQIIFLSHNAGNQSFRLEHLSPLCRFLSSSLGIDIKSDLPLLGQQAFSTSTGTHVAALIKARQYGPDFEDLVFSSVKASLLGRTQVLLLGPNSGRSAVCAALNAVSIPPTESTVNALLAYCKLQDTSFTLTEELAGQFKGSHER